MSNRIWLAALALVLAGCASNTGSEQSAASMAPAITAKAGETARLTEWLDEQYEEFLQFNPISMTFQGRKDRYDEVGEFTLAEQDRQLAWRAASVAEMERRFDYATLPPQAQISYDVWKYQYQSAKRGVPFRHMNYVFSQMSGVQSFLPTFMISFHRVTEPSDMDAYVKRLSGLARGMHQLIDQAQANAKKGIRPPRFAYEGVLDQAQKVIGGAPFDNGEDSALLADAKRKITELVMADKIDAPLAADFEARTRHALLKDFGPAYERLIAWVKTEIPLADEIATGVGKFRGGRDYYNHRLAISTTTQMTADEVHRLGLAEVARIRGEMEQVMRRVGFEGDLQAFFTHVREAQFNYFPNTDEGRQGYIDAAEEHLSLIAGKLPEFFGVLPKADLVVKRVESYREQDGAAQHYFPGTPDGSRPGIYYAHLSDMAAMPKNQIEVIAYHEGNPGHHMQISIAQELEDIPRFQTQAGFSAFSEGWALYSELLAVEMGAYADPYSDFGRLTTEIWRAIRLVVDTGLHSKGWTEQQAIDYFMANSPEPLASVTAEVQRYIVWPGQATSYKIGMLRIQALRAKAEAALGDQFDIRGFHDTVLGGGAMPLGLLEKQVDGWVASRRN